jgi:hypothetical protein
MRLAGSIPIAKHSSSSFPRTGTRATLSAFASGQSTASAQRLQSGVSTAQTFKDRWSKIFETLFSVQYPKGLAAMRGFAWADFFNTS